MVCNQCGTKYDKNAKFCGKCGAKLEDSNVYYQQDSNGIYNNQNNNMDYTSGRKVTKKSKRKLIIGLSVSFICILLAVITLMFYIRNYTIYALYRAMQPENMQKIESGSFEFSMENGNDFDDSVSLLGSFSTDIENEEILLETVINNHNDTYQIVLYCRDITFAVYYSNGYDWRVQDFSDRKDDFWKHIKRSEDERKKSKHGNNYIKDIFDIINENSKYALYDKYVDKDEIENAAENLKDLFLDRSFQKDVLRYDKDITKSGVEFSISPDIEELIPQVLDKTDNLWLDRDIKDEVREVREYFESGEFRDEVGNIDVSVSTTVKDSHINAVSFDFNYMEDNDHVSCSFELSDINKFNSIEIDDEIMERITSKSKVNVL
ncbi:MAG: zinc ribbon domain-containing protein [Ruminococcus sp.]|nr:zinc ribbon domain-containing protein [Ruminococcus sp.]